MSAIAIPIIILLIGIAFFFLLLRKSKEERKEEARLKQNMGNDFINEPSSNKNLKLEDYEQGLWTENLDKDAVSENVKQYLKVVQSIESIQKKDITEKEYFDIAHLYLMGKYDEWSYSDPYAFFGGRIMRSGDLDEDNNDVIIKMNIPNVEGHSLLIQKDLLKTFGMNPELGENTTSHRLVVMDVEPPHQQAIFDRIIKSISNSEPICYEIINKDLYIMFTMSDLQIGFERFLVLRKEFAKH